MIQETKVCSKCLKEKPLDSFRWLNTQGRYQARCRECEREYSRKCKNSMPVDKRAEHAVTHKLKQISAFKVLKILTQQKETYMTQLKTLQTNIEQWAVDRNLHTGDPSRQVLKLIEEQGELAAAIARDNHEDMADAIGDVTVVAIVMAKQLNAPVDLWTAFERTVKGNDEKVDLNAAIASLAGNVSHLASFVYYKHSSYAGHLIENVITMVADVADALDIDYVSAVQSAYDTIKDRKGKLVNGVFIKEDV